MTAVEAELLCKTRGCRKPVEPGLEVCLQHGGGWPQARRKSELVKLERELDAFITPIGDDHPAADPIAALELERRKCLAKIDWLDHRIANTMGADDLDWGLTKEEQISAAEFTGTNRTYEARIPVLVEMRQREAAHLLRITDLMAKTHFQAATLELQREREKKAEELAAEYVKARLDDITRALGRKPTDPVVIRRLSKLFGQR